MRERAAAVLVAAAVLAAAGCDHLCGCRKPTRLYRDHRELPDVLRNEGPPAVVLPPGGAPGAAPAAGKPTGAYGGS